MPTRPLQLRFLPSLSSASVVFRRKLLSPRLVAFFPLGTNIRNQKEKWRQNGRLADFSVHSDGIARVHGMSNVQAEELVEYVSKSTSHRQSILMVN